MATVGNVIPLEMSEKAKKKITGATWRIARYYEADREDVESRLVFAHNHAKETYDPASGVPFEAYEAQCFNYAVGHVCRKLKKRADENRHTRHFADKIRGEWTVGDTLRTRRAGPAKMWKTLAIREWLDGLKGVNWLVAIASLCGLKPSEIARKLDMPRSSYDRRFAPVFAALRGDFEGSALTGKSIVTVE